MIVLIGHPDRCRAWARKHRLGQGEGPDAEWVTVRAMNSAEDLHKLRDRHVHGVVVPLKTPFTPELRRAYAQVMAFISE